MTDNFIVRFLLSPGKWRYSYYKDKPDIAIKQSLSDLDSNSNHVSIFFSDNLLNIPGDSNYKTIHFIAFLFSASMRPNCQDINYIDITKEELEKLGIKIRYNKTTSSIKINICFDSHGEIYLNKDKKMKLSKLIFEKIASKYNETLPKLRKKDILKIKDCYYSYNCLENNDFLNDWAKE